MVRLVIVHWFIGRLSNWHEVNKGFTPVLLAVKSPSSIIMSLPILCCRGQAACCKSSRDQGQDFERLRMTNSSQRRFADYVYHHVLGGFGGFLRKPSFFAFSFNSFVVLMGGLKTFLVITTYKTRRLFSACHSSYNT